MRRGDHWNIADNLINIGRAMARLPDARRHHADDHFFSSPPITAVKIVTKTPQILLPAEIAASSSPEMRKFG
jgi:hypothetical protein